MCIRDSIGTPQMNISNCNISSNGSDAIEINVFNQKLKYDFNNKIDGNINDNYFLGIRPRSFDIIDSSSAESLTGEVDLIENMGAEVLLHVKIKDTTFRTVQSRSHKIKLGDTIHLRPKKGQVHLFGNDGKVISNG